MVSKAFSYLRLDMHVGLGRRMIEELRVLKAAKLLDLVVANFSCLTLSMHHYLNVKKHED
ncbi:hypothetical protein PCS_01111 [Desulfocurvibacter africanus PCS]|uniref:Uncharacterized protein n=1 Tax=Desulfocurvibacter africanus PCS TaxID=1262666 RepID=M5PVH8_DESAF|nr:hypothetical protein PCS_01111 [Desulfocurvibacter africanus PCS]